MDSSSTYNPDASLAAILESAKKRMRRLRWTSDVLRREVRLIEQLREATKAA